VFLDAQTGRVGEGKEGRRVRFASAKPAEGLNLEGEKNRGNNQCAWVGRIWFSLFPATPEGEKKEVTRRAVPGLDLYFLF